MILAAVKSFAKLDKETYRERGPFRCEYGDVDKATLKVWNAIIKKLRKS